MSAAVRDAADGGDVVAATAAVASSSSSPSSASPSAASASAAASGAVRLTIVLKIGSASLSTPDGRFVHLSVLARLVELICRLRRDGHRLLLVTSGAVSIGCQRLSLSSRPTSLVQRQAVAAVGQSRLMRIYDDLFSQLQQPIAQVLLSRENLSKRHHYLNAFNTFTALLDMGCVPIVNENDTVAVEELRVGDNDTLSALVASLVQADFLFLLTDVPALYTSDPRIHPDSARAIHLVDDIDSLQADVGGGGGEWGTGGMATKLQAARIASSAGCRCCIVQTAELHVTVPLMLRGDTSSGTTFLPLPRPLRGNKRFIAHGLAAQGIVRVVGSFPAQSSVRLIEAASGREIGRGVVNYDSREIGLVLGRHSRELPAILHYVGAEEVVHRDSLVCTLQQHT